MKGLVGGLGPGPPLKSGPDDSINTIGLHNVFMKKSDGNFKNKAFLFLKIKNVFTCI